MRVAIDGPSGAGKSTIAKMAANELGYIYIDTGAMYRTVGLYCVENNIKFDDVSKIIDALNRIKIDIKISNQGQVMYLNGENVSEKIRMPEISNAASAVAVIKEVREYLVNMQREMSLKSDVLMDGRDIGTCVLPDAEVKIFLTASPEARAKRRYDELKLKGVDTDYNTVLKDIIKRDKNDSEREHSPLSVAKDAVIIDTTDKNLEESLKAVVDLIKNKGNNNVL